MKAIEFDAVDNTYLLINKNTEQVCKTNDIEYYSYLGCFVRILLFNYIKYKKNIEVVENLNFRDKISVKAVLNKAVFGNKQAEIDLAKEKFEKHKKLMFDWLDKTKSPYFFILNPVYEYGAGISYFSWFTDRFGYIKVEHTGSQNIDIAFDYMKYKL
jgi:hypothetical protein